MENSRTYLLSRNSEVEIFHHVGPLLYTCSYRLKVRIQDLQSCDAVAESAGSANNRGVLKRYH